MIRSFIFRYHNINSTISHKMNASIFKQLKFKWDRHNINVSILDICPSNRKNVEELELKTMKAVQYITKVKYDFVVLGIGYMDYDKMLRLFNRANLIKKKNMEPVHANLRTVNGQYISFVQHCVLHNIPHFCLGRDRLTELASVGTALFRFPKEIISLLYYYIVNSEEIDSNKITTNSTDKGTYQNVASDNNLLKTAPNFYKAFVSENALYLLYNLHAKLLYITKSPWYIPFDDKCNKHSTSDTSYEMESQGNKNETAKKKKQNKIISFFTETTYDQIHTLRSQMKKTELYSNFQISSEQKDIHVLLICDSICVDYLYNFMKQNFALWKNVHPFYNELINMEKRNPFKYSLVIFLFLIAPIAWTITLTFKFLYHLWIEYVTKAKSVSVGGDIFFKDQELIPWTEEENSATDIMKEELLKKTQPELEPVNLLGNWLQWYKNKSRN